MCIVVVKARTIVIGAIAIVNVVARAIVVGAIALCQEHLGCVVVSTTSDVAAVWMQTGQHLNCAMHEWLEPWRRHLIPASIGRCGETHIGEEAIIVITIKAIAIVACIALPIAGEVLAQIWLLPTTARWERDITEKIGMVGREAVAQPGVWGVSSSSKKASVGPA